MLITSELRRTHPFDVMLKAIKVTSNVFSVCLLLLHTLLKVSSRCKDITEKLRARPQIDCTPESSEKDQIEVNLFVYYFIWFSHFYY